jgi:hypothetical protein
LVRCRSARRGRLIRNCHCCLIDFPPPFIIRYIGWVKKKNVPQLISAEYILSAGF